MTPRICFVLCKSHYEFGNRVIRLLRKARCRIYVISDLPSRCFLLTKVYTFAQFRLGVVGFGHNEAEMPDLLGCWLDDLEYLSKYRKELSSRYLLRYCPDLSMLQVLQDKASFYQLLNDKGFPVPAIFAPQQAYERCLSGVGVFVKMSNGSGGAGIRLFLDPIELAEFLSSNHAQSCVLQEKAEGVDVDVSAVASEGRVLAICIRREWLVRNPEGVFSPVFAKEFIVCDWIEEIVVSFISSIQFSGVIDFDLRADFERKRAWFIDCNPRMFASLDMVDLFGINFPQELIAPEGPQCKRNTTGFYLSPKKIPILLFAILKGSVKPVDFFRLKFGFISYIYNQAADRISRLN